MQAVQNIVEDFVEGDFAFVASLGSAQIRSNILLKLFFGYTDGDSAHRSPPLARFLTMMHYLLFSEKFESLQNQNASANAGVGFCDAIAMEGESVSHEQHMPSLYCASCKKDV